MLVVREPLPEDVRLRFHRFESRRLSSTSKIIDGLFAERLAETCWNSFPKSTSIGTIRAWTSFSASEDGSGYAEWVDSFGFFRFWV